jgi:hypothetical protein
VEEAMTPAQLRLLLLLAYAVGGPIDGQVANALFAVEVEEKRRAAVEADERSSKVSAEYPNKAASAACESQRHEHPSTPLFDIEAAVRALPRAWFSDNGFHWDDNERRKHCELNQEHVARQLGLIYAAFLKEQQPRKVEEAK